MVLNWDTATWDAIVTQLVAAGEAYLNECAGGPPLTPVLERLAELSQVAPEMAITKLSILRWREEGPELALRVVLYNWCVSAEWDIRSDGTIFVPALPEPFPHCQSEYAARTFRLAEGRFVEGVAEE
jgi:hypothetical protein